ncbi:hypothetical protein [Bacillus sp. FJAT-49736]|uniref:hypothetical protein n=1 Tax=Bacillus sp. FJAT-49736 TaxID=2833582 RepID=UPI001BC94B2A|nr:hypothetical protein [Bacillus sp. FJAT-49736]MBS4173269.1 hypothetical protein [Bacillus sp. FJAT-49736]
MYIIEKANIAIENLEKKTSLLVKDNKIYSMKDSYTRNHYIRMDLSDYVMTPTHVMLDLDSPPTDFQAMKQYFIENFLLKGCNTMISTFSIQYENQFEEEKRKKMLFLLNSPIDYIMAVRLPLEKLTTSLIRKCKRNSIPIIFVEINRMEDIFNIAWGWIREAMFPYNPVLVPIIMSEQKTVKKNLLKLWREILEKEKISHVFDEIREKNPIEMKKLKKFGVYPKRGDLSVGSEINYNLYFKADKVDEQAGIHYDKDKLAVMVHKGSITTVCNMVNFRPGFGEELKIKRTSLFV